MLHITDEFESIVSHTTTSPHAPSPNLAILRHLASRTHASAAEIGISLRMTAAEVRARLVMLESVRLIAGRSDSTASLRAPRRVYVVTGEGKRKAGVSDARGG